MPAARPCLFSFFIASRLQLVITSLTNRWLRNHFSSSHSKYAANNKRARPVFARKQVPIGFPSDNDFRFLGVEIDETPRARHCNNALDKSAAEEPYGQSNVRKVEVPRRGDGRCLFLLRRGCSLDVHLQGFLHNDGYPTKISSVNSGESAVCSNPLNVRLRISR